MDLFDTPHPRFIGHRGFTPLAPENSLPSFEAAGRVGMWAIETDLHLTRDGVLVCCHNPETGEFFDGNLPIAETSYPELRKLRIIRGNRADELPPDSLRLPTFPEYLAVCQKYRAIPFIESKTPDIDRILHELTRQRLLSHSVLSSIRFSHLEECRRRNKEIFIHHIFSTPEQLPVIAALGNCGVSYNYPDPALAPPFLPELTHRYQVRLCLRAADTPAALEIMLGLGLDYIPTNTLTPRIMDQLQGVPSSD